MKTITKHAAIRQQQRNVKQVSLELLSEMGRKVYDHRGGYRMYFDKRAQQAIRTRFGKAAAQLRLSIYAVFDTSNDNIITVGHLTRRVKEAA